jgi:NitT/TauT family transport system ATP-binding protein
MAGSSGRLEVQSLSKIYEIASSKKEVLSNLSLVVESGSLTVLMGPAGSGKSVLVNLLAGYEKPTSGSITIDGQNVIGPAPDRLVVFQETSLFPWLTTFENVAYGPKIRKEQKGFELKSSTLELLRLVGLEDFKDRYPSELSGGMQRRAELVRALANRPKVLLLDEPFRGLDAMTRALMRDYFLSLFEKTRTTSLFITSELDEALLLADKIILLTNSPGRLKAVLDVPFPRPRTEKVLDNPEYLTLKAQALELLYEEALKSFAAGKNQSSDFVQAYQVLR